MSLVRKCHRPRIGQHGKLARTPSVRLRAYRLIQRVNNAPAAVCTERAGRPTRRLRADGARYPLITKRTDICADLCDLAPLRLRETGN
ncbi:hypothetical protein EVAR_30467_1 [Eumeta japonica]|uniref:Uncharacterized protein n=1 Tax=Eumeta variegata TaxID=151549 RepID=A0A4C1VY21_EUMVA|nr:hypothetical protein EVAR_30467_1 [Eumeta japonica]